MRIGIGRVEANYIATNPMIFEELKIGDMLICVHKDDYFKMQKRIEELMQKIIDLTLSINNLNEILNLEIIKELKEELDILES